MPVGVVACAAFAGHSVVQGEAVHGEVICVAGLVLEDDSALDEFVDAAAALESGLAHVGTQARANQFFFPFPSIVV